MYCHPPSQKTPRADRLRQWYVDMIEKARLEGLVVDRSNLTDYHFSVDKNLLTLPNFDGDYWPGVAEGIFEEIMKERDLEEKDRRGNRGKTKKPKTPVKKKDEVESDEQSQALKRLRDTMEKAASKEDFLVVQMHYKCAKCNEYQINGTFWYDRTCKENYETESSYALCETCYDKENSKLTKRQREEIDRILEEEEEEERKKREAEKEKGSDDDDDMIIAPPTPPHQSTSSMMPKSKKDAKKNVTSTFTTTAMSMSQRMLRLRKAKVECAESTKDPDPNKDSEFFGTRQAFLSLCQGNHYQFDQLRRAKHSTMMVLYHLHNPQLAGFVHSCNKCGSNIEEGHRYHCETCQDYDLCINCARAYQGKCNLGHRLQAIRVDGNSYADEETRKKRERMIRLHMSLLVHASSCRKKKCPSQNCAKMKALLKHGKTCKKRNKGCNVCRRIWTLLQIHARQCRTEKCKVSQCGYLKNYFRKQQLAADDRRRQAYSAYQQQSRAQSSNSTTTSSSSSTGRGRGRPRGSTRKNKKGSKGSKGTKGRKK